MSTTLAPYDAICFISYGGPNRPEDVLPFMRNATRGRGVPDSRLIEVSKHYGLFGGASPINKRNAELMEALKQELHSRGITIPIMIGNRNWHPFFNETLRTLRDGGAKRVLCVVTSAYASYSGCRQYREDLARALDEIGGGLQLDRIGPFAEAPGFIAANTDSLKNALTELPEAYVLFVTHSIPEAMEQASGADLGSYVTQHHRVINQILTQLDEQIEYELVFCSRSGAPHVRWLEPDVNDRLEELASQGISKVITVPIGFINDHMEVVYDLDTQARQTAEQLNLRYLRAATAGIHTSFISTLADVLTQRALLARGEDTSYTLSRFTCPSECCLPHLGASIQPAID